MLNGGKMRIYYVVVECMGRSITKSSHSETIKEKINIYDYIHCAIFGKPKTL